MSRGQIHGFDNRGSVDAKFLAIATPAVFGSAYFRAISEVLAASSGGPPDMAAIGEVMRATASRRPSRPRDLSVSERSAGDDREGERLRR